MIWLLITKIEIDLDVRLKHIILLYSVYISLLSASFAIRPRLLYSAALVLEKKEYAMEILIPKEFDLLHKERSEEAQRLWRKAVGKLVKNRRRRFRYAADLEKRSEAKEQMRKLRVRNKYGIYAETGDVIELNLAMF